MDMDMHFFVELPDPSGYRFRSENQAVVVMGTTSIPRKGAAFVNITAIEPESFARDNPAFTSIDWIEVDGPARFLADEEYVDLLVRAKVDRRLVDAVRRVNLAARSRFMEVSNETWPAFRQINTTFI